MNVSAFTFCSGSKKICKTWKIFFFGNLRGVCGVRKCVGICKFRGAVETSAQDFLGQNFIPHSLPQFFLGCGGTGGMFVPPILR